MISNNGTIKSYSGLARGTGGRNRTVENADTPFGRWQVTDTKKGELGRSYGKGKVYLKHLYGEDASDRTLDLIRLHGGGAQGTHYSDSQPLVDTWGCVRMHNKDAVSLINDLRAEGNYGDDSVYIGDYDYLTMMRYFDPRFITGNPDIDAFRTMNDVSRDFDIIEILSQPLPTGTVTVSYTIHCPEGETCD